MKNRIATAILTAVFLLPTATTAYSAEQEPSQEPSTQHSFLCSDIGAERVLKISAAGKIEWEKAK